MFSKLINEIYQLRLQNSSLVLVILKDDYRGGAGGNAKSSALLD